MIAPGITAICSRPGWEEVKLTVRSIDEAQGIAIVWSEKFKPPYSENGFVLKLDEITPEIAPQQAEVRSDEETITPYPIGTSVRLKASDRLNYVVLGFEDLNESRHDHLKPGQTTWYYELLSERGDRAFWYHNHLIPQSSRNAEQCKN